MFEVSYPLLDLLKIIHAHRRRLSVLFEVGVIITAVTDRPAIFEFNDSIHPTQYIAVVRDDQHGLARLRAHPVNELLLGYIIHVVGRLINQRQMRFRVHNLHDFHQPLLATRQGTKRPLATPTQLEIIKLPLNLLLNLVKAFLVKSLQRLSILLNLTHIIAHGLGIFIDNFLQARIFRQPRQDVAQHRLIAQTMMLLRRTGHGDAAPKNHLTSIVGVRARQDAKQRRLADAITADHANLLAIIHTKLDVTHQRLVTKTFFGDVDVGYH